MLQVAYIKKYKDHVLKGLAIRNFADAEIIVNQVIELDEKRKATQTELDKVLAESNKISKEIGFLYKAGEQQKAAILKEKTGQLKEQSKLFNEQLSTILNELNELLYQIPNIPNVLVPSGTTEDDNEEVFSGR